MSDPRFVIVAQPRTGSTFLHLQLLSYPQVVAYGEILHPVEGERSRFLKQAELPMITLADDPVPFLKKHVFRDYARVKAVGFKLFYKHARNDEWKHVRDYLRDSQVKVIHLKRRNLLDRYLSFELAMKSAV